MDTILDSMVPQFVVGPGCTLRVMSLGSTGPGCSDGRKASLQFWPCEPLCPTVSVLPQTRELCPVFTECGGMTYFSIMETPYREITFSLLKMPR